MRLVAHPANCPYDTGLDRNPANYAPLTPISFMQLPVVALFGWLLFDEALDSWTLVGAGIIFGANAYIAHREAVLSRRAASEAPSAGAKPGE